MSWPKKDKSGMKPLPLPKTPQLPKLPEVNAPTVPAFKDPMPQPFNPMRKSNWHGNKANQF